MVVAHHIAVVVHPFQVAVDLLVAEDPAADGNQKNYTIFFYTVFEVVDKSMGVSYFNGTCRG